MIVDEVHAIAGTKRGAHLALTLERLERLVTSATGDAAPAQRIGLSRDAAPARDDRPLPRRRRARPRRDDRRRRRAQAARAPGHRPGRGHEPRSARSCRSTSSPAARRRTPRRGSASGRRSTRAILELIRQHRSTIVFTNSRRLAERLAQRLNELAGEELVRAHHGSIAREQRVADRGGAQGRPPAGARRHEQPRARHRHGRGRPRHPGRDRRRRSPAACSGSAGPATRSARRRKGVIFPKYRGDLLEAAVVAQRMHAGAIEATTLPRNPLDVLAQQIVAMTVMDRWTVDDLLADRDPGDALRDAQPRGPRGRPRRCSPAPTRPTSSPS